MQRQLSKPEADLLLLVARECPANFPGCGELGRRVYNKDNESPYDRARVLRSLWRLEKRGLIERGSRGGWLGASLTSLGRTRALVEKLMPSARKAVKWRKPGVPKRILDAGLSLYQRLVIDPADKPKLRVLKPGSNNDKLGLLVQKGHFRGYHIYSLTLEERATCPRACQRWADCFGNNMMFAQRFKHGPSLEAAIVRDLEDLMRRINPYKARGPKRAAGILIRLHVLGDFYSFQYVEFWRRMLQIYPKLAVFGYTAHEVSSAIGFSISSVNVDFGRRSMIRFSGQDPKLPMGATWYGGALQTEVPPGAFACPEQQAKVESCAVCAACWEGTRCVAFRHH